MRKAPGSRCHRNQKRNKGLYWGNRVRRPMPHWHTLADFLDETDLVQELQKYHHAAERSDRSVGFGHGNHLSIDDSGCLNLGACLLLRVLACHCSKDTPADQCFNFGIQVQTNWACENRTKQL